MTLAVQKTPSKSVTESLDPLALRVKDLCDHLFQCHYLDCTERPRIRWVPFQRKGEYHILPESELKKHKDSINQGIEAIVNSYKRDYFYFFISLPPRFQKIFPSFTDKKTGKEKPIIEHPDFSTVEPEWAANWAFSWCHQHLNEMADEVRYNTRQANFIRNFNSMNYVQIAREHPDRLRFQPTTFELPPEENAEAWAARVDKYLEEKFYQSGIEHRISCYMKSSTPPVLAFFRILTRNKEMLDFLKRNKEDIKVINDLLSMTNGSIVSIESS